VVVPVENIVGTVSKHPHRLLDGERVTGDAHRRLFVCSLFGRLAEPAVLVPLAEQKRVCMRTVLPSARG